MRGAVLAACACMRVHPFSINTIACAQSPLLRTPYLCVYVCARAHGGGGGMCVSGHLPGAITERDENCLDTGEVLQARHYLDNPE